MPKVKTHQGAAKRLRRTKSGKIMHRASGQDHFNSRDTGEGVMGKRRDSVLHGQSKKAVVKLIPYK